MLYVLCLESSIKRTVFALFGKILMQNQKHMYNILLKICCSMYRSHQEVVSYMLILFINHVYICFEFLILKVHSYPSHAYDFFIHYGTASS